MNNEHEIISFEQSTVNKPTNIISIIGRYGENLTTKNEERHPSPDDEGPEAVQRQHEVAQKAADKRVHSERDGFIQPNCPWKRA